MPSFTIVMNWNFNQKERDSQGNLLDPAKLYPALKGDAGDVEVYLKLADLYCQLDQEGQCQEMGRQALKILQPQIDEPGPKDCRLLLAAALADNYAHPEEWQRQEQWLREAVELEPGNWRVWERLAHSWYIRAETTVMGQRSSPFHQWHGMNKLRTAPPPEDVLAKIENCLREAGECLDRAKELAPSSEEQWNYRTNLMAVKIGWGEAINIARGKKSFWQSAGCLPLEKVPEFVREYWENAPLATDSMAHQLFGIWTGVFMPNSNRPKGADPNCKIALSPADAKFLKESLARARVIASKSQGETARFCHRLVAILHVGAADNYDSAYYAGAEESLHWLRANDPKNGEATSWLAYTHLKQKRFDEAISLLKDACERNPPQNASTHYALAKAYEDNQLPEDAARELDTALHLDAGDARCLAGQAALLMRQGEQDLSDDDLTKAGRLLEQAHAALKPGEGSVLFDDTEYLQALFQALCGEGAQARLRLDVLRLSNPANVRYAKAIEALSQ